MSFLPRPVFLHVDGYALRLFTDSDVPRDPESCHEYNKVVDIAGEGGRFTVDLRGSTNRYIPYTLKHAVNTDTGTKELLDYTFVQPPGGDDMNIASIRPVRLMSKPNRQTDPPRRVWRVLPLGRMGTWDRSHRGGIQTS